MAIPQVFRVNTTSKDPFDAEVLATLPPQQQILEKALLTKKYVARSIATLSSLTGLTEKEVVDYCDASAHIARSPFRDNSGNTYYGAIVRLQEKYILNSDGTFHEELDFVVPIGRKYDVFISYGSADNKIVAELKDDLEKVSLTCFMAEKDISVTSDWQDAIRHALRVSRFVLIVLTPRSINRSWVLMEAGAAWALGKKIIPALAHVTPDQLPAPISRFQARIIETTAERNMLVQELKAI